MDALSNKQSGQALPLGLALILISALTAYVVFNVGQTASKKEQLVNAADAAAYSALLWQARALNFQAYTNRAMVANQVSMAQAVSLRSWSLYSDVATDNIDSTIGLVPIFRPFTNALNQTMAAANAILEPVSRGTLGVVNSINGALSKSQTAMFNSSFLAAPEIINSVVKANNPDFDALTAFSVGALASNLSDWQSFTDEVDNQDQTRMDERVAVIEQSLDKFSTSRNFNFFDIYVPINALNWARLERRGSTKLIRGDNGVYEWKAKDALSVSWQRFTWRGVKKDEVPVGWSIAFANSVGATVEQCNNPFHRAPYGCGGWLRSTSRAERWADLGIGSLQGSQSVDQLNRSFSGVRAFRTLSEESLQGGDPRLALRVEVSLPLNKVRAASAADTASPLSAPIVESTPELSSVATAEVFYRRPDEAGSSGLLEQANGYNPYWDVRLKTTTDSDRLLAMAMRQPGGHTSTAPGALRRYQDQNSGGTDTTATQASGLVPSDVTGINQDLPSATDLAQVAQSLGVDLASLPATDVFSAAAQYTDISNFNEVVNAYATESLAEIEDTIRDELYDALEGAVSDLLSGIIDRNVGGLGDFAEGAQQAERDFQAARQQVTAEVNALAGDMNQAVAGARAEVERMERDFARQRQAISNQFVAMVQQETTRLEERVAAIQAQIDSIATRLENSHAAEREREDMQRDIADLRAQIRDERDAFEGILVRRLQGIVQSVSGFPIPHSQALEIVRGAGNAGDRIFNMLNIPDSVDIEWDEVDDDYLIDPREETTDAE